MKPVPEKIGSAAADPAAADLAAATDSVVGRVADRAAAAADRVVDRAAVVAVTNQAFSKKKLFV